MKNTIIQMSVTLLLFFGVATSSQATFIHGDKTADSYTGGWGSSYVKPMARHHNWRQSYSATTGVHGLGRYFAWKMRKIEETTEYEGEHPEYVHTNGSKPVPEPSIIALFGLGLFGLGLARRRIRK